MQNAGEQLHNYVFSREMVDFVTRANECCGYLEDLTEVNGKSFIAHMVRNLSGTYTAFLKLEETEPQLESSAEPVVTEEQWSALYQRISSILGPHNDYLRAVKENEFDRTELAPHTISEDIADLYQELRDFTTVYARGVEEMMNDAAWELSVRFAEHWGKKLLLSLTALHELYIKGVNPEEEV